METRRAGERGLLVTFGSAAEVASGYRELRDRAARLGAVEVVPGARTVLLDGLSDVPAAEAQLRSWRPAAVPQTAPGPLVELPARYDGPDLEEVARQWGRSVEEVVGLHRSTEFVVAFCGFAPGFAYCSGLPAWAVVSRRAEPRASVPAGAIGLAGEFTGVYPRSSPGGWQLIGTTSARLWRPDRSDPALLTPGTRVRFVDE